MSFLFGKKQKGNRDAAGTPPAAAQGREKAGNNPTQPQSQPPVQTQANTPGASVNNSLNSLGGDPPVVGRMRTDSESQSYGRPHTAVPGSNQNPASLYPWSKRRLNLNNTTISPFPRYGAAVNTVASKDGDMYIMGGLVGGATVKGDLWMIEAGGGALTCFPVKTEAEGPGPRVGHASLLVGNAFIVYGGDTKQDENDVLDDTLYLLNTSTKQWSRALPPGTRPSGRYGHTLSILGSKLYIFGGQVDGHFFNDLVAFDLNQLTSTSNRWEMLVKDTFENEEMGVTIPPGRTNHTVITYNDKLYLFGGTDGIQWFNDVWTFDPQSNSWTQQDCIGYIPQPREGHSAALVGDVMYIFGGRNQEGVDLGDLSAFRITSRRWYTFQNMGPAPSPRSGHTMTAYEKQIILVGGEPSSEQKDPTELTLVYVLDTGKIRYPNDQQIQQTPSGEQVGGNRRPSGERSASGPLGPGPSGPLGPPPSGPPQAPPQGARGPPPQGPPLGPLPQGPGQGPPGQGPGQGPPGGIGSRLPRAAGPHAAPGPPPQMSAPPPRMNGSSIPVGAPRSRTPPRGPPEAARGPSLDRPEQRREMSPAGMDPRGPSRALSPNRALSPAQNMMGPFQGPQAARIGNTFTEDEERSYNAPSQQAPRHNQHQTSLDNSTGPGFGALAAPARAGPPALEPQPDNSLPLQSNNHENNLASQKQIEDLTKELDLQKSRNAWFASELSLARKAGYTASSNNRISLDGHVDSFGEENRPLIEALVTMRKELGEAQRAMSTKVEDSAKQIAVIEKQRDAAIKEAAYSKAKLAAHGGSQAGTPQLDDSTRDGDSDRNSDYVRKLAAAIQAQEQLRAKIGILETQLEGERKAKEIAEDNAEASQKRLMEVEQDNNPMELESLRAELHEVQKIAREESALRAEAVSRANLLEVDQEELQRRLDETSSTSSNHGVMLVSLREAVTASQDKYALLERKLQQERDNQENVQRKLNSLRADHEERTAELESTTRKLRDAEELAEKHANEAETHRALVMTGLDKLNTKGTGENNAAAIEKRIAILQKQVKESNDLVSRSQQEADTASDKLRRAEERIAGLEAYQQQASREGVSIRKQLQEAVRTAQVFQTQHSETRKELDDHRRDASALQLQHGALKDLLEERSASSAARNFDSPSGGRLGSPDIPRLRELEAKLEESRKAQLEAQQDFEVREQESERAFRERLEQLENDYQSAVSYVKGTEKMLKRMKDELTKAKAQNQRLQSEVDHQGKKELGNSSDAPAGWESEKQALQKEIDEIHETMKGSISQLERQMDDVRTELETVTDDRDEFKSQADQLSRLTQQAQTDIEKLRAENTTLSARAMDAESKVSLLLDQVESSVDNYRQSQHIGVNGRNSHESGSTVNPGHSRNTSTGGESQYSIAATDRNSLALDNLASELETLRTQWEGSHRSYRLSNNIDLERTPSTGTGGELSSSLASWRKRLAEEERVRDAKDEPQSLRLGKGGK